MKKPDKWAYVFILPFFITFLIFTAFPLVNTFMVSFTNESLESSGLDDNGQPIFQNDNVGLENYKNEIEQPLFWQAFANTWIIWLPNIIAQLALALFLAWILTNNRLKLKLVKTFRAIYFFPNLVTISSIAILLYALFDYQKGPVNYLLFGTEPGAEANYIWWFNDAAKSQIIVAVVQTWMWFGYTMILFIAGINSIPESYFEAAVIDGASEWSVFSRITMPLITPVMSYIVITSLIGGLQMFDLPYVLTQGTGGAENSLTTSMVYMYNRGFNWDKNLGGASAVSWMLFIFTAIFSFLYLKISKRFQGAQ